MQTDPLADFLTQIRNANSAYNAEVRSPYSRMKSNVANILKEEGFIKDYEVETNDGKQSLKLRLKVEQTPRAIRGIKRVSKPGLRRYVGSNEIPRVLGGLGVAVLSTSKGVLTGQEAKKQNVGGELLLYIW